MVFVLFLKTGKEVFGSATHCIGMFLMWKTEISDRLQYQKINGIGDAEIFGGDDYIYYSYIVEGNTGDLWLTTWDKGVYRYDGKTSHIIL